MDRNLMVSVTVSGEKDRVVETLDTLAKASNEYWRKVYKVPHYDTLYRGTATYSSETPEEIEGE